jgi:hypothetical protein
VDLFLEIQHLDGDMKTLVYENYTKFIAATDTIRSVSIGTGTYFGFIEPKEKLDEIPSV